ncbi:MAG: class I SAM-dependent methyltransferase [Nitrospirae bacterium]|nr:class I SAM-dependent methyltransferase [Nitrospirota bacterium]
MGFYAHWIFPRLMDWVLGTRRVQERRREALAPVYGSVLEIGFGTGLNLPHYPGAVTWLTALDPEPLLPKRVARRTSEASIPVELVHCSAEVLPFEAGRFDCVVSTWTLCTIPDVGAALREVRRVLKSDGKLVFLEHGRSDDVRIAKWQDRFNPLERLIACGCNLNRPIDVLIDQAGLKIARLERFLMPGVPRIGGEMYQGTAVLSGESRG